MDLPGPDAETVSFAAPLSVWRTENYGDIGYMKIKGEPAEAIAAHALMRRLELGRRRGFGSVKVEAAIGASRWSTSVFPQKGGGWFLPVKRAVCRAEGLEAGGEVRAAPAAVARRRSSVRPRHKRSLFCPVTIG